MYTITIHTTSKKLSKEIEIYSHKRYREMDYKDLGEKGNYLITTYERARTNTNEK